MSYHLSEIWENMFLMQLCQSVTFHKFDEPPMKVCVIGLDDDCWTLTLSSGLTSAVEQVLGY